MNSENSILDNSAETLPENPVVDPQDYSPPPPGAVLSEETHHDQQRQKEKSNFSKVLPIAAAGVALAAVGAVAYSKSRNGDHKSKDDEAGPELPLDINKASAKELMHLPHIGPAFADRIIKSRPFKTVEDLLNVRGIGEQYLEDIAPHLKV